MKILISLILALSPLVVIAMESVPHAPLADGPISREVILSGGGATHFSCESRDENRRAYHGLYHSMHEFLDGWRFEAAGRVLDPAAGVLELWPWTWAIAYEGGAAETLFMPRRLPGVLIGLSGVAGLCAFEPHVDIRHIWDVPRPDYNVEWNERLSALFIERLDWEAPEGLPRVIAIVPGLWASWEPGGSWLPNDYTRDKARRAMEKANPWVPGRFSFELFEGETASFAVGLGESEQEAFAVARELLDREAELREEAREHFAEMARRVPVTSDERLNKALTWARYSMDQLIMDVSGPGIYAGYHWFTNFWGRDAFISLPGACLVNGDFARARAILASFAEYQLTDPDNPRQGRLPNIVNPDHLQYAGVDGTWWWVRALRLYLDYTRDLDFMREMRPVVDRAIAGALAHAVDEHGLLTHGDGETWMDAGGEANPRSPRGNRAVEVEALWIDGLDSAALFARVAGDSAAMARYQALADRARASFLELFPRKDGLGLADHLNADGSQDLQIRPNSFLALAIPRKSLRETSPGWVVQSTWIDEYRDSVLEATWETVVLPHGVTSLSTEDQQWLPRHLDWSRSHFDDAYHNGDIWYWLTGAVVDATGGSSSHRHDYWPLIETLRDEILDHGALGSLREIRDGQAGQREDFGGATSQAWSLAELLRIFPEAILRVHPQLLDDRILETARLPRDLDAVASRVFIGEQEWEFRVQWNRSGGWDFRWDYIQGDWPEGQEYWDLYGYSGGKQLGPLGIFMTVK